MGKPTVFISYSQEDNEHKKWVKDLADRLLSDGIEVTVDQYDLTLGDRLPQFMEQSVSGVDYVLIICTPTYKNKSDTRRGGVGYEGHIISGELLAKGNERKFIPVIRKGNIDESLPVFLVGKYGIDLTGGKEYENNYKDLVTTIYGANKKPKLGKQPSYIEKRYTKPMQENKEAPIKILGIITDEITVPKMDGTRGSALYKVPFRLSRRPSDLWSKYFLEAWRFPPSFTTMHRPGIASVIGDEIILNGTTVEEVRDYHRETLILCVEEANKKEAEIRCKEQEQREREEMRKRNHYDNVNSVVEEIEF